MGVRFDFQKKSEFLFLNRDSIVDARLISNHTSARARLPGPPQTKECSEDVTLPW